MGRAALVAIVAVLHVPIADCIGAWGINQPIANESFEHDATIGTWITTGAASQGYTVKLVRVDGFGASVTMSSHAGTSSAEGEASHDFVPNGEGWNPNPDAMIRLYDTGNPPAKKAERLIDILPPPD